MSSSTVSAATGHAPPNDSAAAMAIDTHLAVLRIPMKTPCNRRPGRSRQPFSAEPGKIAARQPLSLLLRGVERITRSDRVDAWRDVRTALDLAPRNGLVHALASRLLFALGDFGQALATAQSAWDLGVVSAGMVRYHQAR